MPFPCFRTNARFDGGISGGPVFSESGLLCGLVCSSYPPFEPDEDHASYAVSLWPAMAIPLDLNRVGHPPGVRYLAYELIGNGIVVSKNADRLQILKPMDEAGHCSLAINVPPENL